MAATLSAVCHLGRPEDDNPLFRRAWDRGAAAAAAEVSNKRVVLKRHVTGFPTEDDMELLTGTSRLAVPPGSAAVMVKNLYLSCDPYMRSRMSRHDEPSYVPDFVQGEVLSNFFLT